MRTKRIHLVNPKAQSFTTRPIFMNRALYSPLAGLLAVAALIPQDRYEVILTDENIEPIDFSLKADLVGISAMTSYVNRGYEIADEFRARGIPVIMGGVHVSFMPTEALQHADAVVVGEAELLMSEIVDDLEQGNLKGLYKSDRLPDLDDMPMPRYDLLKSNRYVNKTFVQTSRGCHHACSFCTEHMMHGLRLRHRPIDAVLREIDDSGDRVVAINDADFFGFPFRAAKLMSALKGRNIRWQAGVNSRNAGNDELLKLAAESGCFMLSIGFESISLNTLKNVHKYQNRPEKFLGLIKKIQSYGILVFGLFMFGFDDDDGTVFDETIRFNVKSGLDMCAYSILTPYPGTLSWYRMLKNKRIFSYNWDLYDQGHLVYSPTKLTSTEIRNGYQKAYKQFYSLDSIMRRFPLAGDRNRLYWMLYNLFFRRGRLKAGKSGDLIAEPTRIPSHLAHPPIMPERKDWERLILENNAY